MNDPADGQTAASNGRPVTERAEERRGGRFRTTAAHPLVGTDPRKSVLVAVYLSVFAALFVTSRVGTAVTVERGLESFASVLDSLSAVVIALAVITITLVPLVYAAWNGGPAFAAVIPLVPVALGELATGRYALGLDGIIAVTTAATGCALAVYVTDVRETGSHRPWRRQDTNIDRLLAVTVVVTVAAVTVARFLLAAPEALRTAYAPFGVLWLVVGSLVCGYWSGQLRATGSAAREAPSEV